MPEVYHSGFSLSCQMIQPLKVLPKILVFSHYMVAIIYAEEDFIEVGDERQFEIGTQGQPICITVHPQNDTILETDESFHLEIVASPPVNSSLSIHSVALVIILDDDSEILRLCAQLCLIVFI